MDLSPLAAVTYHGRTLGSNSKIYVDDTGNSVNTPFTEPKYKWQYCKSPSSSMQLLSCIS